MKSLLQKKWLYPLLLTLCFLLLLCLTLPFGSIYGSEGDWFSQHTALAEQFRQIFYETGRIFPDYTLLGGGSNIYDISYYGFLRPDVLFSFLLPMVPMAYIISVYAILEVILSLNLCYVWLKRHLSTDFFAFLGTLLFLFAACLYQAHHQIIFVNYLPFLFLALMGIDRLLSTGKTGLLTCSLFLFYLHSYYFSISGLLVCLLYFLYKFQLSGKKFSASDFLPFFGKAAGSVLLSIGMAAVLLLPTAFDLLSNQKDTGKPTALVEILSLDLSMRSLLYSPQGLGLTAVCLYTLYLSIRRRSTRCLSITLLLCLTLNAIPYLLSGLLYIRYKVLIPFLPLFLLFCAQTLEELFFKKIKHSILALICCLIPAAFSQYGQMILFDAFCMVLVFHLCHLLQKRNIMVGFLLLCLAPALISLQVNRAEQYIAASDKRQSVFSKKELRALHMNENYRLDVLTEPFANANVSPIPKLGRSTIYSSVTNSDYAHFYYDVMHNPIRIRNRVALLTDANPFFSYFMGIRYIQTSKDYLPAGYEIIAQKGNMVIAENIHVLPVAYTTPTLIDTDFLKYVRPISSAAFQQSLTDSGLCQKDGNRLSFSLKKEHSLSLDLETKIRQRVLMLSFSVTSDKGDEVTISINGTRNKLSGKNAPYPNNNQCFTYLLSDTEPIDTLEITCSKGRYSLSDIQLYLVALPDARKAQIMPFSPNPKKGNAILKGTAALSEDGYFLTSLPYRKGYQVYADGTAVNGEPINHGFLGFPLKKGSYEISIFYSPPGKIAGAFISLLCILIFLITYEKEKRKTI